MYFLKRTKIRIYPSIMTYPLSIDSKKRMCSTMLFYGHKSYCN